MPLLKDGQDALTAVGLALTTPLPEWVQAPRRTRERTPVPNTTGGILSAMVTAEPKQLTLAGWLNVPSLAARDAAELACKHFLAGKWRCSFVDSPSRFSYVECVRFAAAGLRDEISFTNPALRVSLTLEAADGASYDVTPLPYRLDASAAPVPIPVGDLPSAAWAFLRGGGSSRTLTARKLNGDVGASLTITGTLGTNEHYFVDFPMKKLWRVSTAGLFTSAEADLTGGDWFAMDPAWSDPARGAFATLELSAGTGRYHARRAYAL